MRKIVIPQQAVNPRNPVTFKIDVFILIKRIAGRNIGEQLIIKKNSGYNITLKL
jgi:hypothetical protein